MSAPAALGWLGIVRLGLVQTALGAIVVLTTSTLNRVMVVELALPAIVPGRAGRPALRRAGAAPALGPRLGLGRRGARPGSSAAWPRWPLGGMLAAVATALDGDAARGRHRARRARLLPDRHRRRRGRAPRCWCCWPRGSTPAARAGGRDDRLDHDDRRASPSRAEVAGSCSIRSRRRGWSRSPPLSARAALLLTPVAPSGASRRRPGERPRRRSRRRPKPPFRDGAARGLGRAGGAPLHHLRLRLDAGLQRAGPDPRALRRLVFGMTPGAVDQAVRRAAWRRAARACCRGGRPAASGERRLRLAARAGCIGGLRRLGGCCWRGSPSPALSGPAGRCARRCSRSGCRQRRLRGRGHRLDDGRWPARAARRARACAWAFGARRRPSPSASAASRGTVAVDLARRLIGSPDIGLRGGVRWPRRRCSWSRRGSRPRIGAAARVARPATLQLPARHAAGFGGGEHDDGDRETFDVVVVGGGPSGRHGGGRPGRARAGRCCCSTGPGGSSPAAARSRRG